MKHIISVIGNNRDIVNLTHSLRFQSLAWKARSGRARLYIVLTGQKYLMKKSSNHLPETTPKSNRGKQSSIRVGRADEVQKQSVLLDSLTAVKWGPCDSLNSWATQNGRAGGHASQELLYLRWESSAGPDSENRDRSSLLKAPLAALHGQSFCVTSTGLLASYSEMFPKG